MLAVTPFRRAGPVTVLKPVPEQWSSLVVEATRTARTAAAAVKPLSDLHSRQLDALRFIGFYQRAVGIAPQLREIMEAVGVTSTSVMHYHLNALVNAGYLTLLPNVSRGIVLSAAGQAATKGDEHANQL